MVSDKLNNPTTTSAEKVILGFHIFTVRMAIWSFLAIFCPITAYFVFADREFCTYCCQNDRDDSCQWRTGNETPPAFRTAQKNWSVFKDCCLQAYEQSTSEVEAWE